MSLVTTCPACGTAFVVKPEHLAARRGDVRCGKCDHVFNALSHLGETQFPPHAVPSGGLSEADEIAEALTAMRSRGIDLVLEAEVIPGEEANSPYPAGVVQPEKTDFPMLVDPNLAVEQALQAADDAGDVQPAAEPLPAQEPLFGAEAPEAPGIPLPEAAEEHIVLTAAEALPQEPEPGAATEHEQEGFLAPAPAVSRISAWLTGLLVFLLLLGVVGQLAYFLRTEITLQFPPLRPWLQQACDVVGCRIELPRKAELLRIDDSDLHEDPSHEGVVQLKATLFNQALYAQAYPQFEVTLTDLEDHPVLRRVFTPQEYLPKGVDLDKGMPADGEIHVKLMFTTGDFKPVGYRVYISYPAQP